MKCIVVFQSKTGFTKRYANWIQEELLCDLKECKTVTKKKLSSYDVIIFGSYIRVERFRGYSRIKALVGEKNKKKLVLYATGASPYGKERVDTMWRSSVPEKDLQSIPHFYLQSGLNYEKMSLGERILMKGFALMMKIKNNKDKDGAEPMRDMSSSYDISSKEYMKPLIDYVRKEMENQKNG
ncbi:hypothetical protein lbkm_0987 [Lachnospiraceae bacterium KM106-2]|nr:hypothetical protein lbkm_0987 [Lachnospiraceae bacterium KM106-2]